MNYIALTKCEVANGSGCRVALWVAGCPHRCHGCHNQQTWDFSTGKEFDSTALDMLAKALNEPTCAGLTITGGEPLAPQNIIAVADLARKYKIAYPSKNLWVFTGYTFETVPYGEILKYIDVLVDGPYIESLRDVTLPFRGSSNQRVIDVKKSLETGTIVELYPLT